jgi:hypothetical protein
MKPPPSFFLEVVAKLMKIEAGQPLLYSIFESEFLLRMISGGIVNGADRNIILKILI